jgi:flagellar motor protein MotB
MRRLAITILLAATTACGGAGALRGKVREAERTRAGLPERELAAIAPQAFAEGEQELRAAKEAAKAGDSLAADLHGEHAVAAYQHALAIARLARATEEEAQAKEALARALEQSQRFAAERRAAERETSDLDKQIKVAREAERPRASGPADPARERARLVAAESLTTQARLLCSAARLVSPQAPGLTDAEAAALDLERQLAAAPKVAPIDQAARARAGCLAVLTKARRGASPESDAADALLGELSRSADPKASRTTDLAPSRDERGVVVTLRSLFPTADEGTLTAEGEGTLRDLGRVAAAHPRFAVQVVIHDEAKPSAERAALDRKRGEAIERALRAGGATRTAVEQAGARAPVFDPADAKRREKNARVEIVFVAGS